MIMHYTIWQAQPARLAHGGKFMCKSEKGQQRSANYDFTVRIGSYSAIRPPLHCNCSACHNLQVSGHSLQQCWQPWPLGATDSQ